MQHAQGWTTSWRRRGGEGRDGAGGGRGGGGELKEAKRTLKRTWADVRNPVKCCICALNIMLHTNNYNFLTVSPIRYDASSR